MSSPITVSRKRYNYTVVKRLRAACRSFKYIANSYIKHLTIDNFFIRRKEGVRS